MACNHSPKCVCTNSSKSTAICTSSDTDSRNNETLRPNAGLALRCSYCLAATAEFHKGWKMRFGKDAQLCYSCFYAYRNGRFCEIFHREDDGWRHCTDCAKLLHCGCVMGSKQFVFRDDAQGVQCKKCFGKEKKKKKREDQVVKSTSTQADDNI